VTADQDWAARGRDVGGVLDTCHVIVVAGADASDTMEVALGIARMQAERRRVAVADLIGDAPPLQQLVTGDDVHGIVDSFMFGVSLNKVAHPVSGNANLFVIPSGSAPLDYSDLFPNPRWGRLSGGFREVGALLVLAAPYDAPKLRDLVDHTDGVVIVGDLAPADVPVAQALAWLRPKRVSAASPKEAPLAVVTSTAQGDEPSRRRWWAAAGGIAVSLLFVAAMFWFAERPFAGVKPERAVSSNKPNAPVAAGILRDSNVTLGGRASDSTGKDSSATTDSFPVLSVTNPGDSAKTSAWGVRLEQTNTPAAAIMDLRGRFESVPAGTYGIDLRTRFVLLVAGAFPSRAQADSLLAQLRDHRMLAPGSGSVISLPYAFLVQQNVPLADVAPLLNSFATRGKPVYALRQPNLTVNLYYGAYESPESAALAVPAARDAGLTPTLVYRIGRVF
jgi:hypothetical protein